MVEKTMKKQAGRLRVRGPCRSCNRWNEGECELGKTVTQKGTSFFDPPWPRTPPDYECFFWRDRWPEELPDGPGLAEEGSESDPECSANATDEGD